MAKIETEIEVKMKITDLEEFTEFTERLENLLKKSDDSLKKEIEYCLEPIVKKTVEKNGC